MITQVRILGLFDLYLPLVDTAYKLMLNKKCI